MSKYTIEILKIEIQKLEALITNINGNVTTWQNECTNRKDNWEKAVDSLKIQEDTLKESKKNKQELENAISVLEVSAGFDSIYIPEEENETEDIPF